MKVATNHAPAEGSRRFTVTSLLNVFGPFLILAFVVALFATIMPADVRGTFFSIYNSKLILNQTVIVAIGALGMTMIIVSGGIDLSVGSVVALTSVLSAWLVSHGYSREAACVAALGLGGMIGLANGSVISGFRMTPFIVTLLHFPGLSRFHHHFEAVSAIAISRPDHVSSSVHATSLIECSAP